MCLLLTLGSAVALVAHHHSSGTETPCVVCVAAHSAAPAVVANLLHTTFACIVAIPAEPVSAKARLIAFALTVRPPPAA